MAAHEAVEVGEHVVAHAGEDAVEHTVEHQAETAAEHEAEHGSEDGAERGSEGCGFGGLSFSADTLVATSSGGERTIASLHLGDKVVAYDPSTGKAEPQPVERVWVNHDANLLDVTLRVAGSKAVAATAASVSASAKRSAVGEARKMDSAETIRTTTNHPWLTADRDWLPAGFLHVGERVVRADGSTATVAAVRAVAGVAVMYDLTIGVIHTFLVGNGRYVVHNCPGGDGGSGKGKDKLGSNVSANKNVRQVARENGIHPDRDKEEYRDFVRELEDYKNSTSRGGADNWPMSKLRAFGQWYFQGDAEAWKVFDE